MIWTGESTNSTLHGEPSTLRHRVRYHNWLDSLPDTDSRIALKEKAAGERMELIAKLVKEHPVVTHAATPRFLQFVDVGDYSPFELAAIYQVWQLMSASERQRVEKLPPAPRRKAFLQKGEARQVAAALKRQGFDEVTWVNELETFAENGKIGFLLQELKSKEDARPGEILRRQAINLHFLEKARPTAVDPDRLADFLASFPPWLQTCFDHHSPDEARRRLTVVYRLVFAGARHQSQRGSETRRPTCGCWDSSQGFPGTEETGREAFVGRGCVSLLKSRGAERGTNLRRQ